MGACSDMKNSQPKQHTRVVIRSQMIELSLRMQLSVHTGCESALCAFWKYFLYTITTLYQITDLILVMLIYP